MVVSLLHDWTTTLFLIFGGCCSNAITLEQLTSEYPNAGSLITLLQFIIISLHGLPRHITWTRFGPRFKPRRIPLTPYLIQVCLFYLISLLNNAAFGYQIPMSVHIIFRSGGLVINMVLGWLINSKKYTTVQVTSVIFVTLGVILTTLSATKPSQSTNLTEGAHIYATGIMILTLALLLSGFLGLVQDRTYSKYGRPTLSGSNIAGATSSPSPAWQESMFYLHFLSLPMFIFVRKELLTQFTMVNAGPTISLSVPPFLHRSAVYWFLPSTVKIPRASLPLLLNTVTQLVCVAGVNRLTTRVSALSVTLVLVVRKAVSLILSVLGVGMSGVPRAAKVDKAMMWTGAGMVLLGTIGYSLGTRRNAGPSANKREVTKKD